jgi:Domain of unknown function (DUF4386)
VFEMTTMNDVTASRPEAVGADLRRTARTTGLLYLGLAVTGLLGAVVIQAQLFSDGDPAGTLANLTDDEWLARAGIAVKLGLVVFQALTAMWFYRLFRSVDAFAAGSLAAFGMVNAVAIMISAAILASALEVSTDASLAAPGGAAATVQLLYVVSEQIWGVAGTFFGLWLIPMGWLVIRSRWLPRLLGWLLIGGGAGYVIGAFIRFLADGADLVADLLTIPATIGEFWIIGYLIIVGVREHGSPREGAN